MTGNYNLRLSACVAQAIKQDSTRSGMQSHFWLLDSYQGNFSPSSIARLEQRYKNTQRAECAIRHIGSQKAPRIRRSGDLLAKFQSLAWTDNFCIDAIHA